MILMGPWTEFYFFAKSVPLLIFAVIGFMVGAVVVVCWLLNKWESFVKRINAKKIKEEPPKDFRDEW